MRSWRSPTKMSCSARGSSPPTGSRRSTSSTRSRPSPGVRAVGEERAWGRRLAKRFGVDSKYEAQTFIAKNAQSGFLDFESSKPDKLDADVVSMFEPVKKATGGAMVVYGWTMAEDLVKHGQR